MNKHTYAITISTGRIGNRIARGLLDAGHHVRVLGRDPARLADLTARGARPFVGDIRDPAFVEKAFDGADAAFLLVKVDQSEPDFLAGFERVGASYAKAAQATGLRNALFVSAMGAHDPSLDGLIGVHRAVEKQLDAVKGLNVFHLRSAGFFDNLLYFLHAMRAAGAFATPFQVASPTYWVSTDDVADLAVRTLLDLPFRGTRAVDARSASPLTAADLARVVEATLGRPFPAVNVPREVNVPALLAAGLSADMADRMQTTWEIFNARTVQNVDGSPTITLTTPIDGYLRDTFVPALTAPPTR
ncbi:MAG: NAD-dependent epimerase/dehydratase family protein [bacterium]|nr:NAD-dependent epimerase/dehydratase family protein [bacterium]